MIQKNFSLLAYNTFHIDAKAHYFIEIKTLAKLRELPQLAIYQSQEKKLVLGGGSNVLLTKDFDGLVVKISLRGIELMREDAHHHYVRVMAGEPWHQFVLWCIERGYAGVENMSLIPGQVGASPIQNIGAYGAELKDVCTHVHAFNPVIGEEKIIANEDCKFGYRDSIFKHEMRGWIITAVDFRLNKLPRFNTNYGDVKATLAEMNITELTIKAVSDAVIHIRSTKLPDPAVLGNAGSFFKNPVVPKALCDSLLLSNPVMPHFPQPTGEVKIPAGWLIEQCGWKGKRVGNTGTHAQQALVLVNYGNATGPEVYQLALDIATSVKQKFGVEIKPEVNLV